MVADQPLYALAKQIQWKWPSEYGKFVVMFGGLHIEMAALRSLGTLLQDSGWTAALSESGVASPGTAESYLTVSSTTRTRQTHQKTACSLYQLLKVAYENYTSDVGDDAMTFDDWYKHEKLRSPQFQFWSLVLDMELVVFALIRSFCEADFELYKSSR